MDAGRARGPAPVRITSRDATSDPRWDAFLAAHPSGDLVQSTSWGETKRSIGQRTRLTTAVGADGELVGGALTVIARVAPGAAVGYVARGPVVDAAIDDRSAVFAAILRQVVRDAAAQHCRFLIVQPPIDHPEAAAALAQAGFAPGAPAVAPEATIQLDLRRSDDDLLADMSTMRRRNVRKVMRGSVVVEDSDDVELFHRLHAASAARQDFEPRSLEYLRSQWTHLRPAGAVAILVARIDDVPVAGIWITSFAGTTTYRLPGWDAAAGGAANVNEALHWAAVQRARAAGGRVYDFGGFDRSVASEVLAGREPDEAFRRSPGWFKLGFCQTPVLLPPASWIVPGRVLRPVATPFVARMVRSPRVRTFAGRLRNG